MPCVSAPSPGQAQQYTCVCLMCFPIVTWTVTTVHIRMLQVCLPCRRDSHSGPGIHMHALCVCPVIRTGFCPVTRTGKAVYTHMPDVCRNCCLHTIHIHTHGVCELRSRQPLQYMSQPYVCVLSSGQSAPFPYAWRVSCV
jgi:hypothetical protein